MEFYKKQSQFTKRAALTLMLGIGISLPAFAQSFVQVNDSFPDLNTGSAAWGDIDNDGDMDVALSGTVAGSPYAGIWVNNGNGSFSELPSGSFTPSFTQIKGHTTNSLAWGDYNNDSRLDLAIVGSDGTSEYAKVWRNDGSNTFFNSFDMVPGKYGAVKWGDADNDGDQDLMLLGEANINSGSVLEINNHNSGSTSFTTSTVAFPHLTRGAMDFGDYDADGDMDLIMCGYLDGIGNQPTTQLWLGDGMGDYTLSNIPFDGLGWGDLDWTDTDCDGDLDLMMSGFTGTNDTPFAWHVINTGNPTVPFDSAFSFGYGVGYSSTSMGDYNHDGYPDLLMQGDTTGLQTPTNYVGARSTFQGYTVFTQDNSVNFPALSQGAVQWIDYDMDGDLDLFSCGLNNTSATNLFENQSTTVTNAPPSAPTNLVGVSDGAGGVDWTWDAAVDDVTPSAGLSYRMILERSSDFKLLTPILSDVNTEVANVSERGWIQGTSHTIRGLSNGETYCAAVIAVDAGYASSTWSVDACASVVVGIDDQENSFALNAWPTPATTVLNVSMKGLQGAATLSVISLDGRTLMTEKVAQVDQNQLDISGIAQGIYLLSVQVEGQSKATTLRFVKN